MNRPDLVQAFGQRVRVALAVSGHTRADLARVCGISPAAVSKWTDGVCYPSSNHLMSIAALTGCSLEWLMWPHPVDIKSTPYAPNGQHIKDVVREVMSEMRAAE